MLHILKRAGIVQPSAWCGKATEMERFFRRQPGRNWTFSSCLVATARSGGLQKIRTTVGCPTLDFESSALNRTQPPFLKREERPTFNHPMQSSFAHFH